MRSALPAAAHVRLEGVRAKALETARDRLMVVGLLFTLAFVVVAGQLVAVTTGGVPAVPVAFAPAQWQVARGAITDRNGVLLATSLPTAALYADPSEVLDPEGAADRLVEVLPDLDRDDVFRKLTRGGRFVWLRRALTPSEHHTVNALGLPGIHFRMVERRVYPQGVVGAHVVGFTDVDNRGLAGIEQSFDAGLADGESVQLSIDVRVQHILREEMLTAMRTFRGIGAAAVVLDVTTGELLAMVSLPDFDPNDPTIAGPVGSFNRVTQGVYEMGSTMKVLTSAMALDSGATSLNGGYDASRPLQVAGFRIRDFHAQNRWLSVPEVMLHSSNIGAAQMAIAVGGERQRQYLDAMGLLQRSPVELPGVEQPLFPRPWRDINTMTIGFGHGIAVTPLHLASAVAAVTNGGEYRPATIIRQDGPPRAGRRIISEATSHEVRALMRLIVLNGTGRNADAAGLRIGGKTGTAEKSERGRYQRKALLSSFIGVFPIDQPRFLILAMVDEPQGTAETQYYATGGWVAAPAFARIAARIAPVLGVEPVVEDIIAADAAAGNPALRWQKTPINVSLRQAFDDVQGRRFAAE